MIQFIATSYEGLVEGLFGWHFAMLILTGLSLAAVRAGKKWVTILGVVLSALCSGAMALTTYSFLRVFGQGDDDPVWNWLILLSLICFGFAFVVSWYAVRKILRRAPKV